MDPTLPARLLALALWASPAAPRPLPVWESLQPSEAQILRSLDDGALDEQRAGALEETVPCGDAERAELEAAEARAPELDEQRGGDVHLTDREVKIILWTAAIVAVVILILA
jgi:hypothetical protein